MTETPQTTSFDHLADERHVLLTTFRRDGTPVPTPVWLVVVDGVLYTSTGVDTGKVKRIRNNPAVTVAACDIRGRVHGPSYAARARLVEGAEGARIHQVKSKPYRLARFVDLYEKLIRRHTIVGIVVEPGL